MRRVRFPIYDRFILTPIELMHIFLPAVLVVVALWFLAGTAASLAAIIAILAGTVLFRFSCHSSLPGTSPRKDSFSGYW